MSPLVFRLKTVAAIAAMAAFVVLPAIAAASALTTIPITVTGSPSSTASLPSSVSGPTNNVWDVRILAGPLVTCTGLGGPGGMPPCRNLCDLIAQFVHVVYFMIALVIWIATPAMFAWGGIKFMTSRGNPEGIGEARKMLRGTAIGLVIILVAYIFVLTFVRVLGIIGVGGFGSPDCSIQ